MYLEIPFLALVLFKRDGLVSPASWWWAGLMFGVYRVTCCWLPPSCRRVDQAGGSDSIGELLRVKWCQVPSFQKQPLRLSCLPRSPQNSRNRWTERDRNMTWVKDYGPRLVFQLASIQPMYTNCDLLIFIIWAFIRMPFTADERLLVSFPFEWVSSRHLWPTSSNSRYWEILQNDSMTQLFRWRWHVVSYWNGRMTSDPVFL